VDMIKFTFPDGRSYCEGCAKYNTEFADKFCDTCRSPLVEEGRFCSVCGHAVNHPTVSHECVCGQTWQPSAEYCTSCGRAVGGQLNQ